MQLQAPDPLGAAAPKESNTLNTFKGNGRPLRRPPPVGVDPTESLRLLRTRGCAAATPGPLGGSSPQGNHQQKDSARPSLLRPSVVSSVVSFVVAVLVVCLCLLAQHVSGNRHKTSSMLDVSPRAIVSTRSLKPRRCPRPFRTWLAAPDVPRGHRTNKTLDRHVRGTHRNQVRPGRGPRDVSSGRRTTTRRRQRLFLSHRVGQAPTAPLEAGGTLANFSRGTFRVRPTSKSAARRTLHRRDR